MKTSNQVRSVPLTQLLLECIVFGKITLAKDCLFATLTQLSTKQIEQTANWFYKTLRTLSNPRLQADDFFREEIQPGMADIAKLIA